MIQNANPVHRPAPPRRVEPPFPQTGPSATSTCAGRRGCSCCTLRREGDASETPDTGLAPSQGPARTEEAVKRGWSHMGLLSSRKKRRGGGVRRLRAGQKKKKKETREGDFLIVLPPRQAERGSFQIKPQRRRGLSEPRGAAQGQEGNRDRRRSFPSQWFNSLMKRCCCVCQQSCRLWMKGCSSCRCGRAQTRKELWVLGKSIFTRTLHSKQTLPSLESKLRRTTHIPMRLIKVVIVDRSVPLDVIPE